MNKLNGRKAAAFFYHPRNLYIIGFILAFFVTFAEFIRDKHCNFIVFANSTLDFWQGISPYTPEWVDHYGRFFLYTPTFSVLFTPFALLPEWLGPFVWNLVNFSLFFAAVFTLPESYTKEQKCRFFLLALPLLAQSLFSFQYNIPVAYLFLFSYTLLEKNKAFWAILLIMVSGCTKIYGIFQLGLLLCYPGFRRNIGYILVTGIVLLALPLLKLAPGELLPYYQQWLHSLVTHQTVQEYQSFFYIRPLSQGLLPYFRWIQLSVLAILAGMLLFSRNRYSLPAFRAQITGILMGWVVLFSDSAEIHTYIIAFTGYLLWYMSRIPGRLDIYLLWGNFFLLGLLPIDIIVPKSIMYFICDTLWLHIWVFFLTWIRMIYLTFTYSYVPQNHISG